MQHLATEEALAHRTPRKMAALHFAPEPFFRRRWSRRFQSYLTADLNRRDVDRQVDICAMPFESESFDFLFASHVLEHIVDDGAAISEIARVLDRADWLCWRCPSSLIEPLNILHRIPLSTDTFGRPGLITTIAIGTTSRLCWCARRVISGRASTVDL